MEAPLRAGIAVYNAGEYHAAHDAWEEPWLGLDDGTDDERFLHGLIQFTAAVYHAHSRNWSGATGLAGSAGDYLAGLPSPYRGVDLDPVRRALTALAADPEVIERRRMPPLRYEGRALSLDDLRFDAAAVAARILAEEYGYDPAPIERATEFAREEIAGGERTLFTTTVMEFVTADAARSLVYRRLAAHVERREREYADVEGLFEE
jgi:predicted metal-dependent hydrolase